MSKARPEARQTGQTRTPSQGDSNEEIPQFTKSGLSHSGDSGHHDLSRVTAWTAHNKLRDLLDSLPEYVR